MVGQGTKILAALLACGALAAPAVASGGADAPVERPRYILGGGPADFSSQWPFAAAILHANRFHCSGSVIDSRHVLTAGHCAINIKPRKLSVVTGRADLRDGAAGQVHAVSAKYLSNPQRRHDLAVLRLATPTSSPPIAVANPSENATGAAPGMPLRVAGWGATNIFHRKLPGFLKTTTLSVQPKRKCFRAYGKSYKSVSMVCAQGSPLKKGRYAPRTSPCGGDSGGPLVADTPGGPRLVGSVSFGPGLCGLPFSPVVFARVSDDLDFIASAVVQP
jgi:elastase-2